MSKKNIAIIIAVIIGIALFVMICIMAIISRPKGVPESNLAEPNENGAVTNTP